MIEYLFFTSTFVIALVLFRAILHRISMRRFGRNLHKLVSEDKFKLQNILKLKEKIDQVNIDYEMKELQIFAGREALKLNFNELPSYLYN